MAESVSNITNTELLNKLEKSSIDPNQKKELEAVIPEMTDQERQELIALINQSNEDTEKAEQVYQEKVGELNKEYEGKMNNLVKKSTEKAFKEYENTEKKEETEILNEVEGEIVNIPASPNPTAKSATATKKKHTLRNLFLLFLFLAILAGAALYGIQYLSNL